MERVIALTSSLNAAAPSSLSTQKVSPLPISGGGEAGWREVELEEEGPTCASDRAGPDDSELPDET